MGNLLKNTLTPCKDCKDRHTACHDSCEVFKSYKEEKDRDNRNLREYKSSLYGASRDAICFSHRKVVGRGK